MAERHVGFTGTKKGLTEAQVESLDDVVRGLGGVLTDVTVHHGDCIGADETFHNIAYDFGHHIIIHPPDDESRRAFCARDGTKHHAVWWREPKDYHTRNQEIVNEVDTLIACPRTMREINRSGTWSTVRKARKQNKHIIYVYPDGRVEQ